MGTSINDVRRFATIFDPPNVRFLPSNVQYFWVILDTPSEIGHYYWVLEYWLDTLVKFAITRP